MPNYPYEQPLTDADKELLRRLAAQPDDNDLRSLLKKRVAENLAVGIQLVDMLGASMQQIAIKAKALQEGMEAQKKIEELETANRWIGEYVEGYGDDHEIFVQGQGEKLMPLSPDLDTEHKTDPLQPGEKVYVGGAGLEMMVVQRTRMPLTKGGEHGILTAIKEDRSEATVVLDGKQFQYKTTYPVRTHFASEKLTDEDLPLPVLLSSSRQQVTQVLPEPAIRSELNPFLKRDVTLDCHAGYHAVKDDFMRSVLARYMAHLENKVYLREMDLTPDKLRGEAVGIACVGQPGSGKTTLIHAVINWLDALSLLQIQEKIAILKLYLATKDGGTKASREAYKDVCERLRANHSVYRKHFDVEEPEYTLTAPSAMREWAESYIEGYGLNPERAPRLLKRYIKMREAGRSEVQLFLIRHEDVFKKYVGEGVGYLGLVFRKARRHQGFVFIWLPEAETIFKARGTGMCSDYNDEIVAKFNEELAGSSTNDNFVAVLDSNHPQSMDDAILGHRFVRVNVGRIEPEDLPEIVKVHVDRLDLDESLANGAPAPEVARKLICEHLLNAKDPLAFAHRNDGKKMELYPKDVLVPRVVAFIVSRAKKYSLSRKGKKRVNESDLVRACREELKHQASQIKPGNLHLFVNGLDPNIQARCTHVNPTGE